MSLKKKVKKSVKKTAKVGMVAVGIAAVATLAVVPRPIVKKLEKLVNNDDD